MIQLFDATLQGGQLAAPTDESGAGRFGHRTGEDATIGLEQFAGSRDESEAPRETIPKLTGDGQVFDPQGLAEQFPHEQPNVIGVTHHVDHRTNVGCGDAHLVCGADWINVDAHGGQLIDGQEGHAPAQRREERLMVLDVFKAIDDKRLLILAQGCLDDRGVGHVGFDHLREQAAHEGEARP